MTNNSAKHKMVELKARVNDHNALRKKLTALGAKYTGEFHQKDQYFIVPKGRLKVRTVNATDSAELIYYERENISGPKSDNAYILRVKEADDLKSIIGKILKPFIVIEKKREIYQHNGTQIHLDTVKTLGLFIEFERQTSDDQKSVENDQQVLKKLMETLEISPKNLESRSYSDLEY